MAVPIGYLWVYGYIRITKITDVSAKLTGCYDLHLATATM